MANVHYNVAPRYTCGSPAMVSRVIAEQVAREERAAYGWVLEGVYGTRIMEQAKELGLKGIVEMREERRDHWDVLDLITGARFTRTFPGYEKRTTREIKRNHRRALLEQAAAVLSGYIDESGGCDHSVGICFCSDLALVAALTEEARKS